MPGYEDSSRAVKRAERITGHNLFLRHTPLCTDDGKTRKTTRGSAFWTGRGVGRLMIFLCVSRTAVLAEPQVLRIHVAVWDFSTALSSSSGEQNSHSQERSRVSI